MAVVEGDGRSRWLSAVLEESILVVDVVEDDAAPTASQAPGSSLATVTARPMAVVAQSRTKMKRTTRGRGSGELEFVLGVEGDLYLLSPSYCGGRGRGSNGDHGVHALGG